MLGRMALTAVVLVAGFVVFTALGVGDPDPAPAPATAPVPRTLTPRQAYSEDHGRRELGLAPELHPIAPGRFDGPIARYRRYARALAPRLAAVAARPPSRATWREAFGTYLRIGAAYGALGATDDRIRAAFTALERGLWRGGAVAGPARELRAAVARLPRALDRAEITPLDYALRAHEILEDAQRDFLSGTDVPYSGEGVLATAAGVDATREVLGTLRPLLVDRDGALPARAGVARMAVALRGVRAAHGGRLPALARLRPRERARLNGSLGWALQRLAALPDQLATTDPPAVPRLAP